MTAVFTHRHGYSPREGVVMTFGSLFAGIGGFDLGLERAGMVCRWQVEIDPFCRQVLAKHWPEVPRFGDIRDVDFTQLESVDLICGGFPCQPFSVAGKRKGEADERFVWPEFARAIGEARPRVVLLENVPGLLSIDSGRVFGRVLADLANLGFDAEWDCIPAAAVGAPHLRYRLFIVAHASGLGWGPWRTEPARQQRPSGAGDGCTPVGNANGQRFSFAQGREAPAGQPGGGTTGGAGPAMAHANGSREPQPQGGKCGERGWVGDSCQQVFRPPVPWRECESWRPEPTMGRVANGVPRRVDRLRGLGNAVVPQVAEWVGRRIAEIFA